MEIPVPTNPESQFSIGGLDSSSTIFVEIIALLQIIRGISFGGVQIRLGWCPLQESNLQLALRRGSLYPFN